MTPSRLFTPALTFHSFEKPLHLQAEVGRGQNNLVWLNILDPEGNEICCFFLNDHGYAERLARAINNAREEDKTTLFPSPKEIDEEIKRAREFRATALDDDEIPF